MKKLLALMLTLTILLCAAGTALAVDYEASILKNLNMSQQELTTASARPTTAALVLLDYMLSSNKSSDFLDTIAMAGSCKIAAYGNVSVDVYYPTTDGKYLNLFLCVDEISDYGTTNGPSSTASAKYTYYDVSMSDVLESFTQILQILSNNSGD